LSFLSDFDEITRMRTPDFSDRSKRSDRLVHLVYPKPKKSIEAGRRIEMACEMAEAGVRMMEEKIRREHAGMGAEEVARRLQAWLCQRPGAEHGDGVGRYSPCPSQKYIRGGN
jgi:hypothetical protein